MFRMVVYLKYTHKYCIKYFSALKFTYNGEH
jgi:hypothetical protein